MINFFKKDGSISIIISSDFTAEDEIVLDKILNKNDTVFFISIYGLHSISSNFVLILQKNIENGKDVSLEVDKPRLSKYLHSLGFRVNFLYKKTRYDSIDFGKKVILFCGSFGSSKEIVDILSKIDTKLYTIFIVQHVLSNISVSYDKFISNKLKTLCVYPQNGEIAKRGVIYLSPKERHLKVNKGKIELVNSQKVNFAKPSLSVSIDSLSNEYKEELLIVMSCGYERDGVDMLKVAQNRGSDILIQEPKECKADSIPFLSIQNGIYNFVLSKSSISNYIRFLPLNFDSKIDWIEYLLDKIEENYEYNFHSYNLDYVRRRVDVFMNLYRLKDIKRLVFSILFDKKMFREFFLILSINTTDFFRDTDDFIALNNLKGEFENNFNVKIWSAACSLGEEAYSVAMFLEKFGLLDKSLIYATDFNPVVLSEAKNALYSKKNYLSLKSRLDKLPFDLDLHEYFNEFGSFVKVKDKIKKKVMFFNHNLEKDTVFNEFDIIICKNVLIYFQIALQKNVFNLIYDSLKFGGYLILGKNEFLAINIEDKFKQVDNASHIYRKVA